MLLLIQELKRDMNLSERSDCMESAQSGNTQLSDIWHRLKQNKQAMTGLIILATIVIVALTSSFMFDYETQVINQNIPNRLQPPSLEHPFGTDSFGRDTFARVLYGGRISLFIGFTVTMISLVIGGMLGAISGYYGGRIDNIIMRSLDVLLAVPPVLLAIAIVSALGVGMKNLILAMVISGIPKFSRTVRSQVLSLKDSEFVEAAKIAGSSNFRIILVHIIPNTLAPIIVKATMGIGQTIIMAAGLSFLGLGIMPPRPEWGAILSEGKRYIVYSPYLVLFPGLAIMLSVLSLNFIGDGLRDALDPKLKN